MSLAITGYVLEPPRVGGSNSPFTLTPNNLISNQGAFNASFPSDESNPRVEYCAFVLSDTLVPGTGPNLGRSMVDAKLCWTKNEVIQRFDYLGREGRFKPLPGSSASVVGTLSSTANTQRLKVTVPLSQDLVAFPVRIAVGSSGSGSTFGVTLVTLDTSFGTPVSGSVQLSLETGNLNWNSTDLVTYGGSVVRFQRQTFYPYSESTGRLGTASEVLLLSPRPATGQQPLIRVGFGEYLTPVMRTTEGTFSANPASGTVEWAVNTGRLKFNSGVSSTSVIYYDGVVFGYGITVPVVTAGTVSSPGTLSPIPPEDSDLFFRISGVTQFPVTKFVDILTTPGKRGEVQVRRSTGAVRFSDPDIVTYATAPVQAVKPDVPIERGVSLRLFRSPVNLDATESSVKDLSAYYTVSGAILADPVIGAPSVSLPAIPVDTQLIEVRVEQGTGSFVGVLPRLDVVSPPTGTGYVFDFDKRELVFAERKAGVVIPAPTPYGGTALPDPLIFPSNFVLELETLPNSGTYAPLVINQDALVDYQAGVVTFVETNGLLKYSGAAGSISGTLFTDTSASFPAFDIGSFLIVSNGTAKGVYGIVSNTTTSITLDASGSVATGLSYEVRSAVEVLADRYFYDVPVVDPSTKVELMRALGTASNSPRLTVNPSTLGRIRFGTTGQAFLVQVANDAAFTPPGVNVVQISQATGHLNFSSLDLGKAVYSSNVLRPGVDYVLQDALGFIQLTNRLLQGDEVYVKYKDADGNAKDDHIAFLISKELIDHLTPSSVLSFNPDNRRVASNPSPRVYRGGRPQASSQVAFDYVNSTVTFLSPPTITDALPSGPVIDPSERVYIDYYIYDALGGEQTFSVLTPPMMTSKVIISEDSTSFTINGDVTSTFQSNLFLMLDHTEVYSIQAVSFGSGVTTITIGPGQAFRSDLVNPTLSVSSGTISSTYFVTEGASREAIPRGMNRFSLVGDQTRKYKEGTLALFTGGSYSDYYSVSSSKYDTTTGKTEVVLLVNTLRQYDGSVVLKRSVRPVLVGAPSTFTTALSPQTSLPIQVFRKVSGSKGTVLAPSVDYALDGSGALKLTLPLSLNEMVAIAYTGNELIEQGRRLRASYVCVTVPSATNGLLNQILKISYTTFQPDSFFWRVETMTNFRGELVEAYTQAAKASSPTAGPILENRSGTKLYQQGRESVFFQEGYLKNEDIVARNTLKYFNDTITSVETIIENLNGYVVGDHDGQFLFDGLIDNPDRATFSSVTNQIDDRFKISPAPYVVTGPPFVTTSVGTYQEVYKPSPTSRFYPTKQTRFGVTVAGSSPGDVLMDVGVKNLTSVANIKRRSPWAVTTATAVSGATVLFVDDANGAQTLIRPAFLVGMRVAIVAKNGTVLVNDASSLTLTGVTATSVSLGALPVDIPMGSTVRLATNDTVYARTYRLGIDVGVDLERGLLTYIDTSPWASLTPPPSVPTAGTVLDLDVTYNNTSTEPYRFPALDGQSLDDDGNRQFPILSPLVTGEDQLLDVENDFVNTSTGTLINATVDNYFGTGSLDATGTILTNTGGAWPLPMPQVFDVVDILTGPNANQPLRRVTSVLTDSVVVSPAYPTPGVSGFQFTMSKATAVTSGVCDLGSTTSLVDLGGNFTNVRPGMSVVITAGPNFSLRRNVTAVGSTTQLTTEAFPFVLDGSSYRIVKSIATYGRVSDSITVRDIVPNLDAQITHLNGNLAIANSLIAEATQEVRTTSNNGQTLFDVFTSGGQTFTIDVDTTCLLYITSGQNIGFYKIEAILSNTEIQVPFPFTLDTTGIPYKIVKPAGLSYEFLRTLQVLVGKFTQRLSQVNGFRSVITTNVGVSGDPGAFASKLEHFTLNIEEYDLSLRLSDIPSQVDSLKESVASEDRLYDSRFLWIDSRINLQTGILPRKERSVTQRQDALKEAVKQMTKLLSIG